MATQAEAAQFKHLFTPLRVGSFTVRNRIACTAVGTGNYAISRAKGGIGLIITGSLPVHPSSGSGPNAVWSDDCIEPFRKVTEAVHQYGGRYVGQLEPLGPEHLRPDAPGARLVRLGRCQPASRSRRGTP